MNNASFAKQFFIDRGWAPHQAAGIVGNLMQESGMRTDAVGDNGNSFGIAQWNGPRRRAFMAYAKEKGVAPVDLQTQLDYIDHELRTSEKSAGRALAAAGDVASAAQIFSEKYERPGVPKLENRIKFAQQIAGGEGAVTLPGGEGSDPIRESVLSRIRGSAAEEGEPDIGDMKAQILSRIQGGQSQEGTPDALLPDLDSRRSALKMMLLPFADEEEMLAFEQSLANDVTLGFADEFIGGFASLFGHDYEEVRDEERRRLEALRQRQPGMSQAGSIIGTASAAVPAFFTGGGTTLAGAMAQGAGIGGLYGALSGFGGGEGAEDRLDRAQTGGVTGAALGAVAAPVMAGASAIARPIVGKVMDAFGGGAERQVAAALRSDGLSPADVMASRMQGKPDTLLDLAGENTRGLGRQAIITPNPAKTEATEFLEGRVTGQVARISDDATSYLQRSGDDFNQTMGSIAARQRARSAPMYRVLEQKSAPNDDAFKALLERREVARALDGAIANHKTRTGQDLVVNDRVPFQVIDAMKKELDRLSRFARTPQSASEGLDLAAIRGAREDLLKFADKHFRSYERARGIWSSDEAIMEAGDAGRSFMKGDIEDLAEVFDGMTKPQKEAFRHGAAREIRSMIEKMGDNRDAAITLMKSPDVRDRLQALTRGHGAFNNFLAQLRRESTYAKTRNDVLGGSQTQGRQTVDAGMGALTADAALGTGGAITVSNMVKNALSRLVSKSSMSPRRAEEITRMMIDGDIKGVLDRLAKSGDIGPEAWASLTAPQRRALVSALGQEAEQFEELLPVERLLE